MATITEAGFALKTLQEYLSQVQSAYLDIDSGWNIEPESPDGMAIAIWSELLANLDEALAKAYSSVDPDTAVGQQLDRVARISGIDRKPGTFSTATVTFSGDDGTVIPQGTEVRNSETETIWETDTSVEISGGDASVQVTCTTRGPEPAGAGDLNEIVSPIAGVSSVTNNNAASLGRATENDAALRVRRNLSVASPGKNQVDSTFGRIANIDEVKHARIYENTTSSTDSNGLDPHSMAIFVNGGDTVEIAEAIANTKAPGCGLNADNSFANKIQEDVTTDTNSPLTVTFFRPVLTTIYVEVTIQGTLSSETIDDIKQAIVDYSNAELFGSGIQGFDKSGFGIGEIIPASKLHTPVHRVIQDNAYVSSILIGEASDSINQSQIDPGFNGLGVFSKDNISVVLQ